MTTSIVPFQYESFTIRTVVDESGETLWVAKDVAEVLGYSNTSDAISRHCKGVAKHSPLATAGGVQNIRVIREPDLYRLITNSQLEGAVRFEAWVFEEVLPSIRKAGKYESPVVQPNTQARLPERTRAVALLEEELTVCSLLQVPVHVAQVESVKTVRRETGRDFSHILVHAPAQSNILPAEEMMEVTELGAMFGKSGAGFNKILAYLGFQAKVGGQWTPTAIGEPLCLKHHWSVGPKSGYNLKWNVAKIKGAVPDYLNQY